MIREWIKLLSNRCSSLTTILRVNLSYSWMGPQRSSSSTSHPFRNSLQTITNRWLFSNCEFNILQSSLFNRWTALYVRMFFLILSKENRSSVAQALYLPTGETQTDLFFSHLTKYLKKFFTSFIIWATSIMAESSDPCLSLADLSRVCFTL